MAIITDAELERYKNNEKALNQLQEQNISTAQVHVKDLNEQQKRTKKFKTAAIILGLLALIGVTGTYYHFNDKISKQELAIQEFETNTQNLYNEDGVIDMDSDLSLEDAQIYAVQIGAFEERDLALYSDNFVNFREIRNEGFNKYALGNFESLDEAKAFRRELVDLGMKDAFIGFYENGERQRIEKVED